MILKSKICGVSDSKTLNFLVNHDHPPQFVGFIVNYPKSNRYVALFGELCPVMLAKAPML